MVWGKIKEALGWGEPKKAGTEIRANVGMDTKQYEAGMGMSGPEWEAKEAAEAKAPEVAAEKLAELSAEDDDKTEEVEMPHTGTNG